MIEKLCSKKVINMALAVIFAGYLYAFLKIVVLKFSFWDIDRTINIVPIIGLVDTFQNAEVHIALKNILGNIAIFIPLGIFCCMCLRKVKNCIGVILSISLLVEVFQFVFACGLTDIDDVILNTLGGMLGVGLCEGVLKRIDRRFRKRVGTVAFLMAFGLAGVWSLYEYQPNMLPTQIEEVHQELVADFIEREDYISGKCIECSKDKVVIVIDEVDGDGMKKNYPLANNAKLYIKAIQCEYTSVGDVRKVLIDYKEIGRDKIEDILKGETKYIDIYLDNNGEIERILIIEHIQNAQS